MKYFKIFIHARREAWIIFGLWFVCLLWAVPYSYMNGYPSEFDPDNFSTIFGIPSWLFWGIAFPWILADIFTTWFCFSYMEDDDLNEGVKEGGESDE